MCQVQLCPYCNGSGQEWHSDPHVTSVGYFTTCHMCGGWGYIYPSCCPPCCKGCPPTYYPPYTPQHPYYPSYIPPYWHYDGVGTWWYSVGNTTIRINIIEDPNVIVYGNDTLPHDHDSEHNPHDCQHSIHRHL